MSKTTEDSARGVNLSPARAALLEKWKRGRSAAARQAVPKRSSVGPAVLSFPQERLWLLDRLLGSGNAYNTIPLTARLTGPLDVSRLERSLAEVVRRHEVMRTRVLVVDGNPRQVVEPSVPVHLEVTDLREFPDPEAEAMRLVRQGRDHSFDLAEGPLFRMQLFRISEQENIFLHLMHHMISDGWSDDVLIRDLVAFYLAFESDTPSPLPALPLQYADYAEWQRDRLSGETLESLLGYWRGRLAGAPSALELPVDKPRPAVQRFVSATYPVKISAEVTSRLKALGQAEDATLFMTLLAAVNVLLGRYSGQSDIVVGSPIANRTRVETEGLIGCFINTLALRTDLSGNPGFRELLGRVRETALGAYAHQDLPFERLVDELQPDRDISRNPLFQVMFALQNSPPADLRFGDFRLSTIEMDNGVAKFDITIDLREFEGELIGRVQFDSDLFEPATCERIIAHLHTLLAGIAARPDQRLSELPLMDDAELELMLTGWNATGREFEPECVHRLIEAMAARYPDAVAVSAADGQLTYGQLDAHAGRLARRLRGLGAGPDTMVGLCVERSVLLPVGILGILKAGCAYVPLDPTHPIDRLTYILGDAQAPIVVTQSDLTAKLSSHPADIVCLDEPGPAQPGGDAGTPTPDNIAYVIYTSGSTGRPKGVMISHRAVTNMIRSTLDEIDAEPGDVVLQFATLCFDVSVLEIFGALCSGARLVIPDSETVLNPDALTSLMVREQVTIVDIAPAVVELLSPDAIPSLRIQLIGGEAFSGGLATRWQQPGRRVINGYGPTEATVMMTVMELDRPYTRMPPIGTPMPNHQVYVLDLRGGPVPVGVPGELYIGGLGLARGYLNRPGLTAERFVPDAFTPDPGARLYRTGDLVRFLADGVLEFVGRVDHQVKIRGYRIETGEIEAVLGGHPSVRQAVVVVREDRPGAKNLVAYVQPEPDAEWRSGEVRACLSERLPAYMVPQMLVPLSSFPLLPSGKIDRSALPDPAATSATHGEEEELPRTELERRLGETVFAAVLGVDRVGVHDNFFQLGGNSLQLARLQSRISEELAVDVPLRVLFDAPSVAALASYLETRSPGAGASVIPARERPARIPLTAQQQHLWRRGQWYNKPLAVRLRGLLDVDLLSAAVHELAERHEMLRTTFDQSGDEPVQVPHASLPPEFTVLDMSADGIHGAENLVRDEVTHGFDLAHGPVFRVQLLRLDDYDHVLVATLHPLLWDGWSRGVLARELLTIGDVVFDGRTLSPLPIHYADYALWQREWLAGLDLGGARQYWKDQLAGAPPSPRLPGRRADPGRADSGGRAGARHRFPLPQELAGAVAELTQAEGVTLFTGLLAAFTVALRDLSGQDDVVLGVPMANRVRPGTEGLIGQFVNTLPIRVDVLGTFRELLSRLHSTVTDAQDHQELPPEQPGFEVGFDLLELAADLPEAPGVEIVPMEVDTGRVDFDLILAIERRADGLHAALAYATEVYPAGIVAQLAERYLAVLREMTAAPDTRLGERASNAGDLAG